VVAAHTVTTIAYMLRKHHDMASARAMLAELLRIVEVTPVDRDTIDRELASDLPDFEVAVQMAAAGAAGATTSPPAMLRTSPQAASPR
jgi:hypothetical protein